MPGVDFTQPLASASARAATDWAGTGAGAQVTLMAAASLSRGFNLDLGVLGMANVDASLSKFLTAEVTGEAHAAASLRGQVQVPMNLFSEIGLAVRLEAVAELAAGVEGSLGVSVGDFVALVERTPGMEGLPATLLRVLLDEITLEAGIYAKASLSAEADAHLVIVGTAIANPARSLEPGFTITGGMGAGLTAGAGYRVFANLGVESFSRLYARSVDVLVDEAVATARGLVGDDADLMRLLDAARAPAKIGLRLAYELGDYLATHAPGAADGPDVALRAAQVVLEEGQRFLLSSLAEHGLGELLALAQANEGTAAWDAALPKRRALAQKLRERPAQPFEDSQQSRQFWADVVTESLDLATSLGGGSAPLTAALSVAWAGAQLLAAATARVVRTQAQASVIGLPPQQAQASFSGELLVQPPGPVDKEIRARVQALGTPAQGPLRQEHLVEYLCDAALVDSLRAAVPGVDTFLVPFAAALGQPPAAVAATFLQNIGALSIGGTTDSRQTLETLVTALRSLVDETIETQLAPPLRARLAGQADVRMAFDEILLPSLRFATATVFDQVLRWGADAAPRDQLTEALSGIVMRVFGRSVVAISDVLLAQAQAEIGRVLLETAGELQRPGGIVEVFAERVDGAIDADEIAEVVADALRVGAVVLGPLPPETRATLRRCMYEIVDMLPPDADEAFLADLAAGDFVPRRNSIEALAGTLATVAVERFLLFVQEFLVKLAERLLDDLSEFVDEAIATVVQWINDVVAALEDAIERLGQLAEEILQLAAEVAERFAQAGEELLGAVAALRRESARDALIDALADMAADGALDALQASDVWGLISWNDDMRRDARALTRSALRTGLDNDVVDLVLDAAANAADALDDLLDDLREVDPGRALAPQLTEILLDRVEEAIDDALEDPIKVPVGFRVDFSPVFKGDVSLGRIEIELDPILDAVRQVAADIGAFEDAVDDAAAALAAAFAAEGRLAAREDERDAVEGERERLQRHADEAVPLARGLEILAPVVAEVVDRPAAIDFRIAGATASLLDVEDDVPPRVFVVLNGRPLSLDEFARVSEGAAPPTTAPPARTALPGRSATATATAGLLSGFARSAPGGGHPVREVGSASRGPAPQRGRGKGRNRAVERRDSGKRPGLVTVGPAGGFATRGLGVPVRTGRAGGSGSGPALRLRRPLLPGELREGLNTLAVVVVWSSGEEMRRAVSFVAQPAATVAPRPRPPAAGRPGRDTIPTKLRGHRLVPQGLLVPSDLKEPHMPRGREDPAMLAPAKPTVHEALLGIPARSARRRAAGELARAAKENSPDPARRLKAVSRPVAMRRARPRKTVFPPVVPKPVAPRGEARRRPPPEPPPGPHDGGALTRDGRSEGRRTEPPHG